MNIRKTRKEDVPVIMDLYENAKELSQFLMIAPSSNGRTADTHR